jgi:hypothetical protein
MRRILVTLTVLSIAAAPIFFTVWPGAPGVIAVGAAEASSVFGGSASQPADPNPQKPSDISNEIVLKNIQYIPQQIHIGVSPSGIRHGTVTLMSSEEMEHWEAYKNRVIYASVRPETNLYCGIAAALMVRSKLSKGAVMIPYNTQAINDSLTDMAFGLNDGRYGGPNRYAIDVTQYGLLYTYPNWSAMLTQTFIEEQFDITKLILSNLYTARKQFPALDFTPIDNGYVSNIEVYCEPLSVALNRIWKNIETNREPAVIICDLSVAQYIHKPNSGRSRTVMPHYNVIVGVRKNKGAREFYAFDPWETLRDRWYTEAEMKELMEIDYRYPVWLWELPYFWRLSYQTPCYVGIVNGY